MKDRLGIPLAVGDKVIYTTGAQSNSSLEIGEILEINPTGGYRGTGDAMIRTENGRKATNWRGEYELISIQYHNKVKEYLQGKYPEKFI